MIKGARGRLLAAAVGVGISVLSPCKPAYSEPTPAKPMKLGYVELADDPRYVENDARSGIIFPDLGRPYHGSEVALEDARAIGRVIKVEFSMEKATVKSVDELFQQVSDWVGSDDVHFVVADLPAALAEANGLLDGLILTDTREPQARFEELAALLPLHGLGRTNLVAPPLLGISPAASGISAAQ